jgi:hypothetical protein
VLLTIFWTATLANSRATAVLHERMKINSNHNQRHKNLHHWSQEEDQPGGEQAPLLVTTQSPPRTPPIIHDKKSSQPSNQRCRTRSVDFVKEQHSQLQQQLPSSPSNTSSRHRSRSVDLLYDDHHHQQQQHHLDSSSSPSRRQAPGRRHHDRTRSLEEWANLFGIPGIQGGGDGDVIKTRQDYPRRKRQPTRRDQQSSKRNNNGIFNRPPLAPPVLSLSGKSLG